ncbi:MAG: histidine phosphatase family protein [Luminiphilus sp.]|nr:histidine phosphatase family protein [Luminiphilus sp.]
MKQLHLIRHAKSSWDDPSLGDHQRPLNARGQRASVLMGTAMSMHLKDTPAVFVSTAVRAQQTFQGLLSGWTALEGAVSTTDDRLYTFDAHDLIAWLSEADDRLDHMAVIGHNPALSALARLLYPQLTRSRLPTAAWLWLSFDDVSWRSVVESPEKAELVRLCTPKNLAEQQ